MFSIKSEPRKTSDIDEAISDCIEGLKGLDDGSEEYARAATCVKTLMEARRIEEETYPSWFPGADTIAVVTGNILGIVAILTFEKANVITSKALSIITKPRI